MITSLFSCKYEWKIKLSLLRYSTANEFMFSSVFFLTFLFALKPPGWKLVSNYPAVEMCRCVWLWWDEGGTEKWSGPGHGYRGSHGLTSHCHSPVQLLLGRTKMFNCHVIPSSTPNNQAINFYENQLLIYQTN